MRRTIVVLVLLAACACACAHAGEWLVRTMDWRTGAPFTRAQNMAQDRTGFLWIGSEQGLFRYDGSETRRVTARPASLVEGCAAAGRVLALTSVAGGIELVEVDGLAPRTLPDPVGARLMREAGAACGSDGALWLVSEGVVYRERAPGGATGGAPGGAPGTWDTIAAADPADPVHSLAPGSAGTVLALSVKTIRALRPDRSVAAEFPRRAVIRALEDDDGSVVALAWHRDGGHLLRLTPGSERELYVHPGRPMALARRGGMIWAGFDNGLVGVARDGRRVTRVPTSAANGASALLVDREQSLWVATWSGLVAFPEPETAPIDPGSSIATRWMTATRDGLLVSSWSGTFRLDTSEPAPRLVPARPTATGAVCVDGAGRTWGAVMDAFTRATPAGGDLRLPQKLGDTAPCVVDRAGTTWWPTAAGLFRIDPDDAAPRAVAGREGFLTALAVDRDGRVWTGDSGGEVCRRAPEAGAAPGWTCEHLPQNWNVSGLYADAHGVLWAAANGLFRRTAEGRWEAVTSADPTVDLGGVRGLAPSPRGGLWAFGEGVVARLEDAPADGRIGVLERLGAWHGLPRLHASDLREDPDGTLWLAGTESLLRLAAEARTEPAPPPRVAFTALRVADRDRALDAPLDLRPDENRVEVRASAFSFRDPARLRYRYRLHDDEPWSEPTGDAAFRFLDLAPGRYAIDVGASLDGRRWTTTAHPIAFRVRPPWYRQPPFYALVLCALAGLAYGVHRVRLARVVALERQRARIAMDLHDEIGSGLGSIGLLAAVAARRMTDADGHASAARIARIASRLGIALSEIVWSLRAGNERLEAVARYLEERGHAMFDPTRTRFETSFPPAWPDVRLPLPVQRNVLSIALEALANAAHHADAGRVTLSLAPASEHRGAWQLTVADDGHGVAHGVNPGTGLGLSNMKRRADDIGAALAWSDASGGRGTVVTLRFPVA